MRYIEDRTETLTIEQVTPLIDKMSNNPNYSPQILVINQGQSMGALKHQAQDRLEKYGSQHSIFIIIDLKSHKIVAAVGDELHLYGITGKYFSETLAPVYFNPYAKKGDLVGAIDHLIDGIEYKIEATLESSGGGVVTTPSTIPATTGTTLVSAPTLLQPLEFYWVGWVLGALILIAIGMKFLSSYLEDKKLRNENSSLRNGLERKITLFYNTAGDVNEISTLAQFIRVEDNPKLSQDVYEFYQEIDRMHRLEDEAEALLAHNKLSEANSCLTRSIRLANDLVEQKAALFKQLSEVKSRPPEITPMQSEKSYKGKTIKVPGWLTTFGGESLVEESQIVKDRSYREEPRNSFVHDLLAISVLSNNSPPPNYNSPSEETTGGSSWEDNTGGSSWDSSPDVGGSDWSSSLDVGGSEW